MNGMISSIFKDNMDWNTIIQEEQQKEYYRDLQTTIDDQENSGIVIYPRKKIDIRHLN